MSFTIFYEQYAPLLMSGNDNIIKNTFQEIFELLVVGKRMARSKRDIFTQIVATHVNSNSQKVRKWAYHCACFYQNEVVCQSIKQQLKSEQNIENIIWALTALSVTYDDNIKLRRCVGKRHDEFMETISPNYLTDALVLFGGVIRINPRTILLTNNSTDLAALTKIYAYRGLVSDKYPNVTESIIRELELHDDPYVREYTYWSQVLRGSTENFLCVPDDLDIGVRKWQIALQIRSGDEDFIVSALKPLALCPQTLHLDIKVGILRGLSEVSYNSKFVPYINSWFEREPDYTVVFLLIDYIMINCYANRNDGTYFDVIKDSLNDLLLVNYIINKIENAPEYKLKIIRYGEQYTLDFNIPEEKTMQSFIFGSGNVVGSGNNFAIAGDHSSATVGSPSSEINELARLISEVQCQTSGLSDEDKKTVDEALSFVESEAQEKKPRKTIIKNILVGLKAIKGTVQFASAVAALANFFER